MTNQFKPDMEKKGFTKKEERWFLFYLLTPPFIYGLIEDPLWNEWIPQPISKSITGFFHEVFDTIAGFFLLGVMICVYLTAFMVVVSVVSGIVNPKQH